MKLLIELDEEYVKAIDKIRFLVGGRTDRKLQLEIIKAIKNGKALEQESSKPMVEIDLYSVIKQKYIEREVVDKLRAELHATAEMHEDGGYYIRAEWINEYFDKYKGESEE